MKKFKIIRKIENIIFVKVIKNHQEAYFFKLNNLSINKPYF